MDQDGIVLDILVQSRREGRRQAAHDQIARPIKLTAP
jgi:hypothetical protein